MPYLLLVRFNLPLRVLPTPSTPQCRNRRRVGPGDGGKDAPPPPDRHALGRSRRGCAPALATLPGPKTATGVCVHKVKFLMCRVRVPSGSPNGTPGMNGECTALLITACTLAGSSKMNSYIRGISHFVTSMTAPIASGWSKKRWMGFAPSEKRRLCTAHTLMRNTQALTVALSYRIL